ncbi:MAG: transposase [Butyricimonas faecihominis]
MVKVQKISELQPFLGFTEFDLYQDYKSSFLSSDLGRLHSIFPFKSFCRSLGLSSSRRGRHAYFPPEGKVALMLLKAYTGFSDATLIEHLNGNIHFQIFCGVYIHPCRPLTNYKIVNAIRSELACLLNVDSAQQVLALHWKPYLDNLHVMMTDATCYESYLRYPTSVKLLWESVAWLQSRLSAFSKDLASVVPATSSRT